MAAAGDPADFVVERRSSCASVYVKVAALEQSMAKRQLTVELGNSHSDLNATGAGA